MGARILNLSGVPRNLVILKAVFGLKDLSFEAKTGLFLVDFRFWVFH